MLRSSKLLEQTDQSILNMLTSSDVYERDGEYDDDFNGENEDDYSNSQRKGKHSFD